MQTVMILFIRLRAYLIHRCRKYIRLLKMKRGYKNRDVYDSYSLFHIRCKNVFAKVYSLMRKPILSKAQWF